MNKFDIARLVCTPGISTTMVLNPKDIPKITRKRVIKYYENYPAGDAFSWNSKTRKVLDVYSKLFNLPISSITDSYVSLDMRLLPNGAELLHELYEVCLADSIAARIQQSSTWLIRHLEGQKGAASLHYTFQDKATLAELRKSDTVKLLVAEVRKGMPYLNDVLAVMHNDKPIHFDYMRMSSNGV